MANVTPAEQAPALAADKVEDQIIDLDAEQAPSTDVELAAEGTEPVNPEDKEAPTDDPNKTAPVEDSDQDKSSEKDLEAKKRRGRDNKQLAAAMAEIETLKRLVPKMDDAAHLQSAIERELGPPPKETDFADYLAFDRAMTVYEGAKFTVGRELKQKAAQAAEHQVQANNDLIETFKERCEDARKSIKDFDAILASATVSPQNQAVVEEILSSKKGPLLAVYFSQNPKATTRLNEMPQRSALVEIGRIEASLSPDTPKTVTRAPNPIAPLHGDSRPSTKDPDKMSFDEYRAFRKSGGGD